MNRNEMREKAILLRQSGFSYGEICRKLEDIPKGTLHYWFQDIIISESSRQLLKQKNRVTSLRNIEKFNKERILERDHQDKKSLELGEEFFKNSGSKNLCLVGAALYWAEGQKTFTNTNTRYLSFSNSDPRLVQVFMNFLRITLKAPENYIKAGLHLHENISDKKARKYWSDITKLPTDLFYVIRAKNIISRSIRPKKFLPYGTCVIRINRRKYFFIVQGIINEIHNTFASNHKIS
ncbi:MAG: hypothetical protein PHV93_03920 [Candidatus Pacebacteria bacterium]|nr:hypothetical protein [Candidatus Paceibacterota bacterium]